MITIEGLVKFTAVYKVNTQTSYIQAVSTDYGLLKYWITDNVLTIESEQFEAHLLVTESFPVWIKLQCEAIKNKF